MSSVQEVKSVSMVSVTLCDYKAEMQMHLLVYQGLCFVFAVGTRVWTTLAKACHSFLNMLSLSVGMIILQIGFGGR